MDGWIGDALDGCALGGSFGGSSVREMRRLNPWPFWPKQKNEKTNEVSYKEEKSQPCCYVGEKDDDA